MPKDGRGRWLTALPDAVTALAFLALWLVPVWFGAQALRNAMLVMLVEFFLVNASIFLGGIAVDHARPRSLRLLAVMVFGALYVALLSGFLYAFDAWWQLPVFGWLLLGKLALVFARPPGPARMHAMRSAWVMGGMFYVGGVMLTLALPVPALGIDETVRVQVASLGGVWGNEPQRLVAFGLLYFGVSAMAKWRGWQLPRPG